MPGRLSLVRLSRFAVPGLVLGAVLVRLPFVAAPLSSDEGGFLMVAGQWSHGTSLYGDYWVDRPPLLITIYQLVGLVGGTVALRLVGMVAASIAIVLAAVIGRQAAPGSRRAPVLTAAVAAVFVASPVYGCREVDGELLALPFVLAGLLAVLRATSGQGGTRTWVLAGVAAAAALSVKQNMLDVGVAALAAVGWLAWHRRWRPAVVAATAFAAGAVGTIVCLLAWAALHGTTPAGLWDAVVAFRAAAARVIAQSSTDANETRAAALVGGFLVSGALGVLVVAVWPSGVRRRRGDRAAATEHGDASAAHQTADVALVALAVAAWEAVAVVAGGSFWIHYLVGTVPGLVLAAAATARHRPRRLRWTWAATAYAAVVAVASTVVLAPIVDTLSPTTEVEAYLVNEVRPGDTGVVAFGFPSLLQNAGLSSPYPQLWSLPVRVRDPHLAHLTAVLRGPDAPTWVVVDGESTTTWGVDGTRADRVLARRYIQIRVIDTWHVFHLVASEPEDLQASDLPKKCVACGSLPG